MHAYEITDTSIQEKGLNWLNLNLLLVYIGYWYINVHCRKKNCKEIRKECILKV